MKVIFISGLDRSGKTTASKYFGEQGYFVYECSSVVKRNLKTTDKNKLSLFYENSMEELNSIIVKELEDASLHHSKIAIVGIRSIQLFLKLKMLFKESNTLFIESSSQNRYKRYMTTFVTNIMTPEAFLSNDLKHVGWGVHKIKECSDFVLSNDKGHDEFKDKLSRLAKKI